MAKGSCERGGSGVEHADPSSSIGCIRPERGAGGTVSQTGSTKGDTSVVPLTSSESKDTVDSQNKRSKRRVINPEEKNLWCNLNV